jgi:hypothetical protein
MARQKPAYTAKKCMRAGAGKRSASGRQTEGKTMAKTIKQRLDELENRRGNMPVMVFEQTWDNPDLFYLAGKNYNIMQKREAVDKKDLLTRAEALELAGDRFDTIFIVYVKDWRGSDSNARYIE